MPSITEEQIGLVDDINVYMLGRMSEWEDGGDQWSGEDIKEVMEMACKAVGWSFKKYKKYDF